MIAPATPNAVSANRILSRREISTILVDLRQRSQRSANWQTNLILFRLSTCVGLRVSEIAALQLRDLVLTTEKPHVVVRKGKRGKRREVPLWLDRATLNDLSAWKSFRLSQGAGPHDPLLCHQRKGSLGKPLAIRSLQNRWDTIVGKVLESGRASQISCHCGRHSFASHLLDQGFSLAEVRDWLGHSSVSVTSVYLHVVPDRGSEVMEAFDFAG